MSDPTLFPFAPDLRFSPETRHDIEQRLLRFAGRLRRLQMQDAAAEVPDDSDYSRLSDDRRMEVRIARRAERLHRARLLASGLAHLKKEDMVRLERLQAGVRLSGPETEHQADEIAAVLFEEMPWLGSAIELLWRDMRRSASQGVGLRIRPMLLDGPPGVGKTHLAFRFADLAQVPAVYVDVASTAEGFALSGAQRTWSSAAPGKPVESVLRSLVGNPLVVVDEVDKGGVMHSARGVPTSAHHALLSLLEPVTARRWECPYFGVRFDMSRMNWLLSSNSTGRLPHPLRSRLRIVSVEAPSRDALVSYARRRATLRGRSPESAALIESLIMTYPEGHPSLSLRVINRMLEDLELIEDAGLIVH